MKSVIQDIDAIQALTSRGTPTVSVRVQLEDGSVGFASVPSGASTGEYEATELRDGDVRRYRGQGVLKAVNNIRSILRETLTGCDACDQQRIDRIMIDLDGTPDKKRLGANAILGVSLAVAQAAAASRKINLYESIGGARSCALPVPLVNLINGGVHADNNLDVQEFLIVPHGAESFSEAVRMSSETFYALGTLLHEDGYDTAFGDEGGYAPRLESMYEAFDYLMRAIEKAGYEPGADISLSLAVSAGELMEEACDEPLYRFSRSGLGDFTAAQLIELYQEWIARYPIIGIEDGLWERDLEAWKELTAKLGRKVSIVGDDLFATNARKIALGAESGLANSVSIKMNQAGTLTETLEAIESARQGNYAVIVSHRSGDTGDTAVADLSVALASEHIKIGSICRGERTEKFNRLLWIERWLGPDARYGLR